MTPTTPLFDDIQEESLQACSTGNISKLQSIFASINVTASQPATMTGSVLPLEELLSAAVKAQHPAILTTLFILFPFADVSSSTTLAACYSGNPAVFAPLLAHDPSIVDREIDETKGHTPFSQALMNGCGPELAMWLLEQGANVNEGWFGSLSTLGLAYLYHRERLDLLRLMIAKGLDVQQSYHLHRAAKDNRADWLVMLLDAGADPNSKQRTTEPQEVSLLATALSSWSMDAARALIQYGADDRGLNSMQRLKLMWLRTLGSVNGKGNKATKKNGKDKEEKAGKVEKKASSAVEEN